jgi:hypothetical protein
MIDPEIWGPHYWGFLHTIAFCYPNYPTTITKKKYYEFIHNLPLFIPTESISKQFSQLLDKYPVTPYLDNRTSFLKWTHFIHNKINKKLDKTTISFDKFFSEYKFSSKKNDKNNYKIILKSVFYVIIFSLLIYLIYCNII